MELSKRIPQLDGIRGLAILQVLLWHYVAILPSHSRTVLSYLQHLLCLTWSGVDLFFVLSGFLIGGILLDHKDAPNYFSVFYARRFFRILPFYFIILLVGYFLNRIGQIDSSRMGQMIPWYWYLTFTQNFWLSTHANFSFWLVQSWSLAVEEQFYALLPIAIWLVPIKRVPHVLLSMIVLAPVIRIALFLHLSYAQATTTAYAMLPCRMDALLLGVFLAYIMRQPNVFAWLSLNCRLLNMFFAGLLLIAGVMILNVWGYGSAFTTTVGYSVLGLLYSFLVLIAIVGKQGFIKRLTTLEPLRRLGTLAYGIYLVHLLIPYYIFRYFGRNGITLSTSTDFLILLASCFAVYAVAAVSWKCFEKPIIEIGHRWEYRRDPVI